MWFKNFLILGIILAVASPTFLRGSSQAKWRLTSPMHEARKAFLSALLSDGRVMVLGGADTSVEIFDPKSETWTYTRPLKQVPIDAISYNEKVYAYSRADVEEWSPVTGSWTVDYKIDDPDMQEHVLGLISNPLSLVLESLNDSGFSIQILDMKSGNIRDYKDIAIKDDANGGVETLFVNNQLHIVKVGQAGVQGYYYDTSTEKWASLPDLKLQTDYFNDISCYVDGDDILYCLSASAKHGLSFGTSFSIYSIKTGVVTPIDFDPDSNALNNITPFLYLGRHIIGYLNENFIDIDLKTRKMKTVPHLNIKRRDPGIVVLTDHRVLVIGGGLISPANPDDSSEDKATNACEIIDSKDL